MARLISVRVVDKSYMVSTTANMLSQALYDHGFHEVERSAQYPCKSPQSDKRRIYLTFIQLSEEETNGENR